MNPQSGIGQVVRWDDEGGWGVIDSAVTPVGCWVHFSHVLARGSTYSHLTVGDAVEFTFESLAAAESQDGYSYRAVTVLPRTVSP